MDKPVALGEVTLGEGVDSWNTIIFLYNSALKEVRTKVEILNDEFQQVHQYNPIEYIKSRIKAPESIVKKLKRYGYDSSIDNMVNYINDIAGIRIVCSFTSDIYRLAEMIGKQNDLTVISVKDYIRHPKESGYKSYHMLVTVPIFCRTALSTRRWRFRSGRWRWISGRVSSTRSTISLREMRRITSAGICASVRESCPCWTQRCSSSMRQFWRQRRHRKSRREIQVQYNYDLRSHHS